MIPFDKLANIRSESKTRVGGSEVVTKSDLIQTACDFWVSGTSQGKQSDVVREGVDDAHDVIIPISLDGQVRRGMTIELFYTNGDTKGLYLIDSMQTFNLGEPMTDNVLLKVSKLGNG